MDSSLNIVFNFLKTTLGEEYALITGASNELEKLKRLQMIIFNVQKDVVHNQDSIHHETFSDWLQELSDAAYDAEDTIDMMETKKIEILRRRDRFINRVKDFFSRSANPILFSHQMGSSVQKHLHRLVDIVEERRFHLVGQLQIHPTIRNQTTSALDEVTVFGRERDRDVITKHLMKAGRDKEVAILVGMGGIGKTTLAKLIYNNSVVDELFASKKAWVCVSTNFDLMEIAKAIIEQLEQRSCQINDLEALRKKLENCLNGNRYLIILDDVWNDESFRKSWKQTYSFFPNCKILVTTRQEDVKSAMSEFYLHHVGVLPHDYCWLLFKNIVVRGGVFAEKWMEEIGERIVIKCKGMPLAASLLGSMLRTKVDVSEWSHVLQNDIWAQDIEINSALKLTYDHLPLKSRFCFVYCSIFPKDCILNKKDLIQQWTDNGFVFPSEADGIFEDLVSRCFFQDLVQDDYGCIKSCKMHDLIHDLAKSIANYQCAILQNGEEDEVLSETRIRFLSINMGVQASSEIWNKLLHARKLRTLQSFSPQLLNAKRLDDVIFKRLKYLRVLNLKKSNIVEVPSSILNLKLLRYVNFSKTNIEKLPEKICYLANLRTLKLNQCRKLSGFPAKFQKLSKLMHLEIEDCHRLKGMPIKLEELSLLQTLTDFVVSNDGATLNELKNLKELDGNLTIRNLDQIDPYFAFKEGILSDKSKLVSLTLSWNKYDISMRDGDENILRALQPNVFLKEFSLFDFCGRNFPTWRSDSSPHVFKNLQKLAISCCRSLESIPQFSASPLRYLHINDCPNLVEVTDLLEGLGNSSQTIYIHHCPNISRRWSDLAIERMLFSQHLHIEICSKSKVDLTPLLNNCGKAYSLKICGYHKNFEYEERYDISICCFEESYISLGENVLQNLEIRSCPNLTSIDLPHMWWNVESKGYYGKQHKTDLSFFLFIRLIV